MGQKGDRNISQKEDGWEQGELIRCTTKIEKGDEGNKWDASSQRGGNLGFKTSGENIWCVEHACDRVHCKFHEQTLLGFLHSCYPQWESNFKVERNLFF